MPEVAVIVPVYNVEKYLPECLDSILNQTLSDIEIICVNDVTPDNSAFILEEYAKKDNRIKVITHEQNQGLGPARNTGVEHATSPFIAFVDSDDFIAPRMIEILLGLIVENKADMSWCCITKVSENSLTIGKGSIPAGVWSPRDVLENELFFPEIQGVCNKMFCREYLKEIKQLPILIEDEPAVAEYLSYCNKIATINESLYFYRNNPVSLTNPVSHEANHWNQFFNDYSLYFDILKKNFPFPLALMKQSILRHGSLLWNINNSNLLNNDNWKEQEKVIFYHLKADKMQLKSSNHVMHYYLLFLFKYNFPKRIKIILLKDALKLSRNSWLQHNSYIYLPLDLINIHINPIRVQASKVFVKFKKLLGFTEI
jgi:glycosyltransferase involved in cell wall biosynthesis